MKVLTEIGTKHGFMLINEARDYLIDVNKNSIKLILSYFIAVSFYQKIENQKEGQGKEDGYIFSPVIKFF